MNHRRAGVVAVEAAVTLPLLLILMLGVWEVGRMIQVNQILVNAAREGARLAAGGYTNGTPVDSSMVRQAVRDYMTSGGLPAAAVSGAQINLTCQASPSWVDPSNALPLDRFQVNVVVPTGAAFNSLRWNLLPRLTSISQFSVTVGWESLTDSKIVVSTQLPF
jgi:Flp pilus assembly protein TadG